MPDYNVKIIVEGEDRASGPLGAAGGALENIAQIAGGIIGADLVGRAFGAIGDVVGGVFEEGMEAELMLTRLNSVLAATGSVSGMTSQQLQDIATGMQNTTRFTDEMVMAGEAALLTFTSISADVFPDAVARLGDMSEMMGVDMSSAARMLGRALEDPATGLRALRRYGIVFDATEQRLIRTMMRQNREGEAQAYILQALEDRIGGVAEAAGRTTRGQLDILRNRLGEIQEDVFMQLAPSIERVMPYFQSAVGRLAEIFGDFFGSDRFITGVVNMATRISWIAEALLDAGPLSIEFFESMGFPAETTGKIMDFIDALRGIGDWIGEHSAEVRGFFIALGVVLGGSALVGIITGIGSALAALASPVGLILIAVGLLGAAWAGNWGGIRDTLTTLWTGTLQPAFQQIWQWLGVNIPLAMSALSSFWTTTLQPALASLGQWFSVNIPIAMSAVSTFWTSTLQPALAGIWTWLSTNIPLAISTASAFWTGTLMPAITAIGSYIGTTIIPFFASVANFLSAVWGLAATAAAGFWQNVLLPALVAVGDFLRTTFQPVLEAIRPVWEAIGLAIGGFLSGAAAGLPGFFAGISSAIEDVTGFLDDFAERLRNIHLPDWLTPGSATPFEVGLRGIARQLEETANLAMSFGSGMAGYQTPAFAYAGAGMAGAGNVYDQRRSLNVGNVQINSGMDRRGMETMFEEWLRRA